MVQLKIISLFTGIGGFELGFEQSGVQHQVVGYSEINPFSIQVFQQHFPGIPNLGDVSGIDWKRINFNMVVGGSPCTDVSKAATMRQDNKERGLKGEHSSLFYRYVDAIKARPRCHFILENVASMSKDTKEEFTRTLQNASHRNVYCVTLDGSPFTGQARRRYFWTTWEIPAQTNIESPYPWKNTLFPKRMPKKSYTQVMQ